MAQEQCRNRRASIRHTRSGHRDDGKRRIQVEQRRSYEQRRAGVKRDRPHAEPATTRELTVNRKRVRRIQRSETEPHLWFDCHGSLWRHILPWHVPALPRSAALRQAYPALVRRNPSGPDHSVPPLRRLAAAPLPGRIGLFLPVLFRRAPVLGLEQGHLRQHSRLLFLGQLPEYRLRLLQEGPCVRHSGSLLRRASWSPR
jgi:hypothetical protein